MGILNHLGFSNSYDEVEREDMDLVQRTIERAGTHRVFVPPSIEPGVVLHVAVDNFDKNDNKGGSHTILMFFQNQPEAVSRDSLVS